MTAELTVQEKSTAYLTVTLRDKAGVAAQPASAEYWIDDHESGVSVRAPTALSPTAGVVEIMLNKVDNTFVAQTRTSERRRVTIHGVYGTNDELYSEYVYRIANLSEVT